MNELYSPTVSYPRRTLRASIFLIAIECLMLAYPSGDWLISGGLCLCAASRWWTIRRGWCLNLPLIWNSLFLVVLFVGKFSFMPVTFPTDATFVNTELAHEIGCWMVSLQILLLHERTSLKRIPVAFSALGCLVILCAGDVRLHSVSRNLMLVLMMLFVGGLGWFAHAGREWILLDQRRRLRRGILLVTLALAAVPTVYAAQGWHQHERELEILLLQIMKVFDRSEHNSGPRRRSALVQVSNGKIIDPEGLVLRVFQDSSEPLYLRGSALNIYRPSNWMMRTTPEIVTPALAPPNRGLPEKQLLFPLSPSHSSEWTTATIRYLSKEDPVPLAPLHAAHMQLSVSQLNRDELQNLTLLDATLPDSLVVYTPREPEREAAPNPTDWTLRIPRDLDPRLWEIARNVMHGKSSDTQKIQAVVEFFHENFQYQLGLEIPNGQDSVTYFLVERPAAHCEYFASGAALLLRLGGVPTRYITGYVPSERHAGDLWIARRKDAHAWVEAYDSGLGRWVTVEPTPSAGLPERRTATRIDTLIESWHAWSAQFRDRLNRLGIWSALALVLQSTVARVLLGLMLIAGWWGFSRRFRLQRPVIETATADQAFPFQQWLSQLETQLIKHGFERRPHETLEQFRFRILASPLGNELRSTAEWYAEYSTIRYDESEQTAARFAQLELSWQNLSAEVSRR